jgi:hypothetical protein
MSAKMQVLFAKQTGHVLAAFTRTADPEGKPRVGDLTGAGLLVRNRKKLPLTDGETLIVPPETLDISVVDFEQTTFSSPHEFVVGGGDVARLGAPAITLETTLASPPPPTPAPPFHTPPRVNFTAARVTVELDSCFILQEALPAAGVEPERRIAQGTIKTGTHFVSLDWKTSPDGSLASVVNTTQAFFILALVAGYRPLFGRKQPSP